MNSSQHIQSPTFQSRKKPSIPQIPQLNQLPYISKNKASNSPRAHRMRDSDSHFATIEKIRDRQSSSQRTIKESLKSLDPTNAGSAQGVNKQMTISGLLRLREEKLAASQLFNGNNSVVVPKLKLSTLKDKIIILKKMDKKVEQQRDSKASLRDQSSMIKRVKSRSEIPPEFLEPICKSPKSPDLLEVLQDYMFQKKKNEMLDHEQESIISQRLSMHSPRTSTHNLEQFRKSKLDFSLRSSFFIPQPSTGTKKRTPSLKMSMNSQFMPEMSCDDNAYIQSNTVKNKVHHKRGNSWSQAPLLQNQDQNLIHENQTLLKSPLKTANLDQGSFPNIFSTDSPRHVPHQLPSEMSKSKIDFSLKLNPVHKKNENLVPSSESRKNNLLPTTCSTGTKREPNGKIL